MVSETSPTTAREHEPLVRHLLTLAAQEDRGALAALRRSLSDERSLDALRIALPFLGPSAGRAAQDAYALVAALFGLFPEQGHQKLPQALRVLAMTSDSIELRFRAMLAANAEDLPVHLRHMVALLAGHGLAFDWNDVLLTVRFWEHDSNRARREWARAYWGATDADAPPAA